MKAAYSYQIINFIVALATMYLLLSYFSVDDYVLWSVFVTFVGVTVQLESAVQVVSVREIASGYHDGYSENFNVAVTKSRKAYLALSIFVVLVVFTVGCIYISIISNISPLEDYIVEWTLLLLAYSINYYFGINNSILLASMQISFFNNTLSFTRVLNLLLVYLLLTLGYSILGMAVSLMISVVVGCFIIANKARAILKDVKTRKESVIRDGLGLNSELTVPVNRFIPYIVYTLCAFALYKGGVLLVAGQFDKSIVASYALSLQVFTILTMFSMVPIQIWLGSLVKAIKKNDSKLVLNELIKTFLTINVLFIVGAGGLMILGHFILSLIKTNIQLADTSTLLAMSLAFLIEVNIMMFISYLVTCKNYSFVWTYLKTSLISLLFAIVLVYATKQIVLSLLIAPSIMQLVLCLPSVFKLVSKQLMLTHKEIFIQLISNCRAMVLT